MKKFFAIFFATIIFATPVFAEIPMRTVDGVEYVQLRATAEAHDFLVEWGDESRLVYLMSPCGVEVAVRTDEESVFIEDGRVFIRAYLADMFFSQFATPPENPEIHGMLTRVTYGENVAYIFGSMHASRPYWFPLADIAEDAMRRTDVFAFEVNMLELFDLSDEQIEEIEAMQTLPDGMTLADLLPPDLYESFTDTLATYEIIGITYEEVQYLTPVTFLMSLENVMVSLRGVDIGFSIDTYIAEFAMRYDLPIVGLNNIVREFEIVMDIPLEIQATALEGFPDFGTMIGELGDMSIVELYAEQDIERLRAHFRASAAAAEISEFTRLLNHNMFYLRCHIFADEIARLLTETEEPTTFFVTVGMGHIIGCCGEGGGIVLQLLRDMDFEVESLWE